jgi:serine protease AprX
MVNGNYLHDKGFSGTGKLIAVLDAGFLGTDTHPGFDSLRLSSGILDVHNFTLASSDIFSTVDTHGTSVLSTIAGNVPGTFVGSAPHASYALYITEDNNSEQPIELINMLCGAERADSLGADIIITSLGYNIFDAPFLPLNFSTDLDGKTTTAAKGANIATQKGILFVATAGNEGGDSWNRILTPGDADSALTIGSVEVTGINAPTSGYGPNAAGQIKPDVCALGQPANVFTQTGYGAADGTSFSTPQIAGWAACLWEAIPAATPYQLRQAINKCASSYNTPGPQIGYGIPNFECTFQSLNVKDTPPPFSSANWVIAMPNPFTDVPVIAVSPNTSGNVDFRLSDISGKIITSFQLFLKTGYNTPISVPVAGLPAGVYILKAVSATQQQVLRLVKK